MFFKIRAAVFNFRNIDSWTSTNSKLGTSFNLSFVCFVYYNSFFSRYYYFLRRGEEKKEIIVKTPNISQPTQVTISTGLARNEVSACPQGDDGPSQPSIFPQSSSYGVDTIMGIPSNVAAFVDGERMFLR